MDTLSHTVSAFLQRASDRVFAENRSISATASDDAIILPYTTLILTVLSTAVVAVAWRFLQFNKNIPDGPWGFPIFGKSSPLNRNCPRLFTIFTARHILFISCGITLN